MNDELASTMNVDQSCSIDNENSQNGISHMDVVAQGCGEQPAQARRVRLRRMTVTTAAKTTTIIILDVLIPLLMILPSRVLQSYSYHQVDLKHPQTWSLYLIGIKASMMDTREV